MKRILSTLLLLLTLIVGLQPTMAMHYCGENLYFIGVFDNGASISCLTKTSDETDKSSCCNHQHHEADQQITHEGCCENHQIELSTDDFQSQERQSGYNNIVPHLVVIALDTPSWDNNLKLSSEEGFDLKFPPKGYEYLNVDILTAISILII